MDWWIIGTGIAGVIAVICGLKWARAITILRELSEAFSKTADAFEDKNLTKQEAIDLLKEWMDVYTAVKALIRMGWL